MCNSGNRPAPAEVVAVAIVFAASAGLASLASSLVEPVSADLIWWMTFATAVNRGVSWSDDYLDSRRHDRE